MQAVEVKNLGKRYMLLTGEEGIHRPPSGVSFGSWLKRKTKERELWAVRGVKFSLQQGQMLGVIGDNGSGKSTLLKLLAGITYPDEGEMKIAGKVAAMLELGVGFHPELSGVENIFLNGTLLGMSHKTILNRLGEIIKFSGIEDFIYSPVKHYSSGMFARLGFSIAIHSEPDILLVDEILAVGDVEFQLRCLEEIKRLRALGRTIIFVSHNISLVEMFCDEVLWLEGGRIKAQGKPTEVCHAYRQSVEVREKREKSAAHPYFQILTANSKHKKNVLFDAQILDANGIVKEKFKTGEPMKIILHYHAPQPLKFPLLTVIFKYVDRDIPVAEITSDKYSTLPTELKGEGRFIISLNPLMLLQGRYELSAILYNARDRAEIYDALLSFHTIEVETTGEYLPRYLIVKPPCRWEHLAENFTTNEP